MQPKLLDEFAFPYGMSFMNACDLAPPMSSIVEVTTVTQVQPNGASRSQNSRLWLGSHWGVHEAGLTDAGLKGERL